jgi:hypothetical protein
MSTFITRHAVLSLHLAITGLLLVGLVQRTQFRYLPDVAIYMTALLAAYAVLQRIPSKGRLHFELAFISVKSFVQVVLCVQLALMIIHWAYLGDVPLWKALHQQDDLAIVSIRRAAGEDVPWLLGYASHFMIKACVPFALVLAWPWDRRYFWCLSAAAVVYAASLLAKSFVITLFVPIWIAFLIGRQWRRLFILSGVFLVLTIALSTAANPQKLRTDDVDHGGVAVPVDEGVKEHGFLGDALLGVGRRMVLMPGWTVAAWFGHIPSDIPFVRGGAVRPLAAALGVPYVDLTEKMYDLAYPEMAAQNVPGTMGTASFMYGYANFGRWGLLGSGMITALVILLVQRIFGMRWKWAVVLNVFPLLALSGSALPTVLLTHGWALTIALFLWLRPKNAPGT